MTVPAGNVALVAALDTKAPEVSYVAETLRERGRKVHVIDVGVLGSAGTAADTSRDDTALRGGSFIHTLVTSNDPGQAMAVMGRGAAAVLNELLMNGELDAVVGIAGGKGTALFADVVSSLPFTLTKVVVSSARAAVLGALSGKSNTVIIPTLIDLMGLNDLSRRALDQAVSVLVDAQYAPAARKTSTTVGITAFGVTTPAAMRCVERLTERGYEPLVFPANGAGGTLLEKFVSEGLVDAVIDLTTTEIADEVVGGTASAGEDRLRAAGRRGIPVWASAGAVDMVNFGPPETVPERFAGRRFYRHSSQTTLMRTTQEENAEIGRRTAQRISAGTGPRRIVWPERGVSDYDREGGVFDDAAADRAWWDAVRAAADPAVELISRDLHINDNIFADEAVEWIDAQLRYVSALRNQIVHQD